MATETKSVIMAGNKKFSFENFLDTGFKTFHELMPNKVKNILLVSSAYDAFILEEDGRLAEKIVNEYRGLNLSKPPRLKRVSNAQEALAALERPEFDLVLTTARLGDMNPFDFGRQVKMKVPHLPVILLVHSMAELAAYKKGGDSAGIDKCFVWSGNSELLLALIKWIEDRMNVKNDTQSAMVRVVILVEDSPLYLSAFLPMIYKEIVKQTHATIEEGLNDEHHLLRMRGRPKIVLAETYEEAIALYEEYKPYLLTVLSDVRYPKGGHIDDEAGVHFLKKIRGENPHLPLLLLSSDQRNRAKAETVPSLFLDKNSPVLLEEVRSFFADRLGFGDFVFRGADGTEIARAGGLRAMARILPQIPDESLVYHVARNHFSTWFMARCEFVMADQLRDLKQSDFTHPKEFRDFLIEAIRIRRRFRQQGVVVNFSLKEFDPADNFVKIGNGSLGGKARGLAFLAAMLNNYRHIQEKFPSVRFTVPKSLVITTEGFDAFIQLNKLEGLAKVDVPNSEIAARFLEAKLPLWIKKNIEGYLQEVHYPLAIRSSSLLEDAHFQPYAGLYKTYMIPNNHPDLKVRLKQLSRAIKLVYASTYYEDPKAFARSTSHRTEEEKMAVVVQQLTGNRYGDCYYPALSGVARSYNFYPISYMKPEEGIAYVAMGLGKTVVEGEQALRFSPKYPEILPQFSKVDDILNNSQRFFYALNMKDSLVELDPAEGGTLLKREITEAENEEPLTVLASTYDRQNHSIRDTTRIPGTRVLTFAQVLKYDHFPLPEVLISALKMGRVGMGCPVEIEFSVNLFPEDKGKAEFVFLQIRPLAMPGEVMDVNIDARDVSGAFCYSTKALGNGETRELQDIVYVKPEAFDPKNTREIPKEIRRLNNDLSLLGRKYLLIGPGRWGSSDPWLGIPVTWADISGVGAIAEAATEQFRIDPSQGSHFFQNITSLGISYVTVEFNTKDFVDWKWLDRWPAVAETTHLRHVRLPGPFTVKIDGKKSACVMLKNGNGNGSL